MADAHAVGIDLGATRSSMAGIDVAGRTVMLRTRDGEVTTASVVAFDDDEILVGREAKKALPTDPDRTADGAPRELGQPRYSRLIRGCVFPPEVIAACVLRQLSDDLNAAGKSAAQIAISLPGQIDERRRRATLDAAAIAGLRAPALISAPLAAALALAEQRGYLDPATVKAPSKALIYDLGGGSFDVAVVELASAGVRVLANGGDMSLGGRDWDAQLKAYYADEFLKIRGHDPRSDFAAEARLNRVIEEAKQSLSTRDLVETHFEFAGCSFDAPLGRQWFEELTAGLLDRTTQCVRQTLSDARLAWRDISEILLVGGATRMPMVARMLRDASGLEPRHAVNPDEAVARGAAIYAQSLLPATPGRSSPRLVDLAPRGLGIESGPQGAPERYKALFPRGAPLPTRVVDTLDMSRPNPTSVSLRLLEDESAGDEQRQLVAQVTLTGFPPRLAAGAPFAVKVERDIGGRLTVAAMMVNGPPLKVTLEPYSRLGVDSVARWRRVLQSGEGFDVFRRLAELENEPPASREATGHAGDPRLDPQNRLQSGPKRFGTAWGTAESFLEPQRGADLEAGYDIAEPAPGDGGSSPPGQSFTAPEPAAFGQSFGLESAGEPAESLYELEPPGVEALTADTPYAAEPYAEPEADPEDRPRQPRSRRQQDSGSSLLGFVGNVIGHLSASLLGLSLGYYVLCRISPQSNFLHLNLPGIQAVAPAKAAPAAGKQSPPHETKSR